MYFTGRIPLEDNNTYMLNSATDPTAIRCATSNSAMNTISGWTGTTGTIYYSICRAIPYSLHTASNLERYVGSATSTTNGFLNECWTSKRRCPAFIHHSGSARETNWIHLIKIAHRPFGHSEALNFSFILTHPVCVIG